MANTTLQVKGMFDEFLPALAADGSETEASSRQSKVKFQVQDKPADTDGTEKFDLTGMFDEFLPKDDAYTKPAIEQPKPVKFNLAKLPAEVGDELFKLDEEKEKEKEKVVEKTSNAVAKSPAQIGNELFSLDNTTPELKADSKNKVSFSLPRIAKQAGRAVGQGIVDVTVLADALEKRQGIDDDWWKHPTTRDNILFTERINKIVKSEGKKALDEKRVTEERKRYAAKRFLQSREDTKAFIEKFPEILEGSSGIVEDAVVGMARFLPVMGISAVSPLAGTAMTFAQIAGGKYKEFTDAGVEDEHALKAALLSSAAQTPLEMAGNLLQIGALKNLGKVLLKGTKGTAAVAYVESVLKGVVGEGLEEFLQEYPDTLSNIYAKHKDWTPEQIVKEFKDTIGETTKRAGKGAAVGAVGGGLLAGVGGAVMSGVETAVRKDKEDKVNRIKFRLDKSVKDLENEIEKVAQAKKEEKVNKEENKKAETAKPKVKFKVVEDVKPVKLAPEQANFVDKKVEELGSLEAVKKKYIKDDDVSKYARQKAAEIYGGDAEIDKIVKVPKVQAGQYDVSAASFKSKEEATRQMKTAAMRAGADPSTYNVFEKDGSWVFQRRKLEFGKKKVVEVDEIEQAEKEWKEKPVEPVKSAEKSKHTFKKKEKAKEKVKAFHGTNKYFTTFDKSFIGDNQQLDYGEGFSFTDSKKVAKSFAKDAGGNVILNVELDIKNPATNKDLLDTEIQLALDDDMGFTDVSEVLKSKGFDGIKFIHDDGSAEYVVYDPKQITVINNKEPKIKAKAKTKTKAPKTLGKSGYKKGLVVPWKIKSFADKAQVKLGEGYEVVETPRGFVVQEKSKVDQKAEKVIEKELKPVAEKVEKKDSGVQLYSGIDPVAAIQSIVKLNKNIKFAIPHLENLGKKFYTGGKQRYFDWQRKMKGALGDLWEKVKKLINGVWKSLKKPLSNQRGEVVVRQEKKEKPVSDISSIRRSLDRTKKITDEFLGTISTRLANIDPAIRNVLRAFDLDSNIKIEKLTTAVLPYIKATTKMSKKDFQRFDLARMESDGPVIAELEEKYGMQEEAKQLRGVLDVLRNEALAVGYKSNYLKNYHPREVRDLEGLLDYLHSRGRSSTITQVIAAKEKKLGHPLTHEEKVKIVNSLYRGYVDERITLSKPGQFKLRKIKRITPDIQKYFSDSNSALLRYITDITTAVESKKLFGSYKVESKKGEKPVEINLDDTIGRYLLELSESRDLSPSQEREIRAVLKARFSPIGTSGIVTAFKNLTLIDVMGSPFSAVVQLGDIAWSLYQNGIISSVANAPRAFLGMSKYAKEDLGLSRIGAEFSDKTKTAKYVDTVFKYVGLTKIDAIGKEILINAAYNKAVRKAQTEKGRANLAKELEPIFGERTDALIEDFRAKRDSRDVKLYMLNKLCDFQPVALSEVPEKYLTSGNWRVLYMLKTFDIKKFDVYRREIFQKIANKGTRLEGIKNLIRLGMFIALMEGTVDMIKDFFSGKEVNFSNTMLINIAELVVSRYRRSKMATEGIGTGLIGQVLPPFKAINAIGVDLMKAGDGKGLEITRSIPFIGELYYRNFGKGAARTAKQNEKARKESGNRNTLRRVVKRKPKVRKLNSIRKIRKIKRQ